MVRHLPRSEGIRLWALARFRDFLPVKTAAITYQLPSTKNDFPGRWKLVPYAEKKSGGIREVKSSRMNKIESAEIKSTGEARGKVFSLESDRRSYTYHTQKASCMSEKLLVKSC